MTSVPRRRAVILRVRDQQTDDEIIDALDWLIDAATTDRAWLLDSLDRCCGDIAEVERLREALRTIASSPYVSDDEFRCQRLAREALEAGER